MTAASAQTYERMLADATEFVRKYNRFLVVSHLNPDGDAISSTCAVGYLLHQLGKAYILVNQDPVPGKFKLLWGSEQIVQPQQLKDSDAFEAVICVDCADYSRIGTVEQLLDGQYPILNIDHHPTNDHYGDKQLIRPDAAATAEILYDWFQTFDPDWNKEWAACIYTGMLTDTGGFRYANTSPKVMKIASDLLSYGVDAHFMAEHLLEKCSLQHIQLLQKALNTLSFSPDHKISWVYLTAADIKESDASNEDLEGLVNYPRNIDGVEVGLMFREIGDNEVKVSFRSAGQVDVSKIAQHFNGGGHVRAAGATVRRPLSETIEAVVSRIGQEFG